MSDKLEGVMKKPLSLISEMTTDKMLDASQFSLKVCNRLLSTHSESGWRILNPIRAKKAELINSALVEVTEHELMTKELVKICPSEITSGMYISQHGYIGKVAQVNRHETKDELEPFVYSVKMEYVCGDLDMHKYFTDRINNGTARGYLSSQQGNRLAGFYRVVNS